MVNSQPIRIRRYTLIEEAHSAQAVLQDHGIPSHVTGTSLRTGLNWFGPNVAACDLSVEHDHVETAAAILSELESSQTEQRRLRDSSLDMDWICPACSEASPESFTSCWSCDRPKPLDAKRCAPEKVPEWETIKSQIATLDDVGNASPFRVPRDVSETVRMTPDHDLVRRAFRAGVCSAFFPPLAFYSLFLIQQCFREGAAPHRLYWTMVLNGLVIVASAIVFTTRLM